MKIKTSELIGLPLRYAVAMAEGATDLDDDGCGTWWVKLHGKDRALAPSWAQAFTPGISPNHAWPIIDRERIATVPLAEGWEAQYEPPNCGGECLQRGSDSLVAAMRCWVMSKFGPDVEIPDALCN